jgi:hypothetical protein
VKLEEVEVKSGEEEEVRNYFVAIQSLLCFALVDYQRV